MVALKWSMRNLYGVETLAKMFETTGRVDQELDRVLPVSREIGPVRSCSAQRSL